jgi:osmotically-inducible protein OsmY
MIHKLLASFVALFLLLSAGLAKDPVKITDDTISDSVRVRLASDQLVGTMSFQVAVKDGVVTLTGAVEQKNYKSHAEKVAKKAKGVKQVVNNIEVKPRNSR